MIPRCVTVWLILCGLLFGIPLGGVLALIDFIVWAICILIIVFFVYFVEWRYADIIAKWLPFRRTKVKKNAH